MRLFNKVFCSDRITIERAFGQLVRRWGILWLALPTGNLQEIALVQQVAVKLHNLCVDEWLCEKFGYLTEDGKAGTGYPHPKLPTYIPRSGDHSHESVASTESSTPSGRALVSSRTLMVVPAVDQSYIPASDIHQLSDEYLSNGANFSTFRLPTASTGVPAEFTQDLYRDLTSPESNAGGAMANGALLVNDQMRIDYLDSLDQTRVGNLSAQKRLNYALNISAAGLSYDGFSLYHDPQ